MTDLNDDDEYSIPLAGRVPYGAGIRKKGVKFVAGGSLESTIPQPVASGEDIANSYLAIVLGGNKTSADSRNVTESEETTAVCETCKLPLTDYEGVAHHTSLAHQVALQHVHPPNAVDRNRKGLLYLESQGWDPDSRRGLGAQGEGIRQPIMVKEKKDRAGIGERSREVTPLSALDRVQKKPQRLDAKALRKLEAQKKRKGEKLHALFYGNDDIAKYLGEDA